MHSKDIDWKKTQGESMNKKKIGKEEALEALRRYKREFEEKYGVTDIGIFGSIARGEEKTGSDVDVVVKMQKPDLYYMVHIKEKLEETLHTHVDIIHYRDKMNTFLKKRINKEAVYA